MRDELLDAMHDSVSAMEDDRLEQFAKIARMVAHDADYARICCNFADILDRRGLGPDSEQEAGEGLIVQVEHTAGRCLVFRRVDADNLEFRGWIAPGDELDDPAKYEFYPIPPDYEFKEEDRFKCRN